MVERLGYKLSYQPDLPRMSDSFTAVLKITHCHTHRLYIVNCPDSLAFLMRTRLPDVNGFHRYREDLAYILIKERVVLRIVAKQGILQVRVEFQYVLYLVEFVVVVAAPGHEKIHQAGLDIFQQ